MTAPTAADASQRRALEERLADRHEEAARQSLARDVADQEEQSIGVQQEEVVEVAADLARRLEERVEIQRVLAGKRRRRVRQHAHLDPARGLQLAGHARGLLALLLDLAAQRLTLALRLGQGDDEHRGEESPECQRGRGRVEQDPALEIEHRRPTAASRRP